MSAVIFLPGTLCDERVWLPLWRQLNIHQRRYVPLQWANSLEDMLSLTSDRCDDSDNHLVGYSMGGYIAALWALTYPHKVASLTLIGYNPEGLTSQELSRRKSLISLLKQGNFNVTQGDFLGKMVHPNHQAQGTIVAELKAMAQDLGSATLLAQIKSTTPRKDLTQKLAGLPCPITLVAATDDNLVPYTSMCNITKTLTHCHLETVKATGHMMPLEQPQQLADILTQVLNSGF
jgi:pimeloyl-ACP methyl ester carboxylesterase